MIMRCEMKLKTIKACQERRQQQTIDEAAEERANASYFRAVEDADSKFHIRRLKESKFTDEGK